jgi:hypothetical protein
VDFWILLPNPMGFFFFFFFFFIILYLDVQTILNLALA